MDTHNLNHNVISALETDINNVLVFCVENSVIRDVQNLNDRKVSMLTEDSQRVISAMSLLLHAATLTNNVSHDDQLYTSSLRGSLGRSSGLYKNHVLPHLQPTWARRGYGTFGGGGGGGDGGGSTFGGEGRGGRRGRAGGAGRGGGGDDGGYPEEEDTSPNALLAAVPSSGLNFTDAISVLMEYVPRRDGCVRVNPDTHARFRPDSLLTATIDHPGFSAANLFMVRIYFVASSEFALTAFKRIINTLVKTNAGDVSASSSSTSRDMILGCLPKKESGVDSMTFLKMMNRVNSPEHLRTMLHILSYGGSATSASGLSPTSSMLMDTFAPAVMAGLSEEDKADNLPFDLLRPDRVIKAQRKCIGANPCFKEQFDLEAYGLTKVGLNGNMHIRFHGNTCFRLPAKMMEPHNFATMSWNVLPLSEMSPSDIVAFMINCAVDTENNDLATCISKLAKVSPMIVVGLFFLTFNAPRAILAKHEQLYTLHEANRRKAQLERAAARVAALAAGNFSLPADEAEGGGQGGDTGDDYPEDGEDMEGMTHQTFVGMLEEDIDVVGTVSTQRSQIIGQLHRAIESINPDKNHGCPTPLVLKCAHIIASSKGDISALRTVEDPLCSYEHMCRDEELGQFLASDEQRAKLLAIRVGDVPVGRKRDHGHGHMVAVGSSHRARHDGGPASRNGPEAEAEYTRRREVARQSAAAQTTEWEDTGSGAGAGAGSGSGAGASNTDDWGNDDWDAPGRPSPSHRRTDDWGEDGSGDRNGTGWGRDDGSSTPRRRRRLNGDNEDDGHGRRNFVGDEEEEGGGGAGNEDADEDEDATVGMHPRRRRRESRTRGLSAILAAESCSTPEEQLVAIAKRTKRLQSMRLDSDFEALTTVTNTRTGKGIVFPAFRSAEAVKDPVRRNGTIAIIAMNVVRALEALDINTESLSGLLNMSSWDTVTLDKFVDSVCDAKAKSMTMFFPSRPFLDMVHRQASIHEATVNAVKRQAMIVTMRSSPEKGMSAWRTVVRRQVRFVRTVYESQMSYLHGVFQEMYTNIVQAFTDANTRRTAQQDPTLMLTDPEVMGGLGDTQPATSDASIMSMWIIRQYLVFERVLGFVQDHSLLFLHLHYLPDVMFVGHGAMTPQMIMRGLFASGKSVIQAAFDKCMPSVLIQHVSYTTNARATGLRQTMHILIQDEVNESSFGMKNGEATKAMAMLKEQSTKNVMAVSAYHMNEDGTRTTIETSYPIYEARTAATNTQMLKKILDDAGIDRMLIVTSGQEGLRADRKQPTNESDSMMESEEFRKVGRMFKLVTCLVSVIMTAIRAGLPPPNNLAASPLLQRIVEAIRSRNIFVSPRTVRRIFGMARYMSIVRTVLILLSKDANFLCSAKTFDVEAFVDTALTMTIVTEESIRHSVSSFIPHLMDTCRQELVDVLITMLKGNSVLKSVSVDPKTGMPFLNYITISLPEGSSAKTIIEHLTDVYKQMFRRVDDFKHLVSDLLKLAPDSSVRWETLNWPVAIKPVAPRQGEGSDMGLIRLADNGTVSVNEFNVDGNARASMPVVPLPLAAVYSMANKGILSSSSVRSTFETLNAEYADICNPRARAARAASVAPGPRDDAESPLDSDEPFSPVSRSLADNHDGSPFPGQLRQPQRAREGPAGIVPVSGRCDDAFVANLAGSSANGAAGGGGNGSGGSANGQARRTVPGGSGVRGGGSSSTGDSSIGADGSGDGQCRWATPNNPSILIPICPDPPHPHFEKRATQLMIHISLFHRTESAIRLLSNVLKETQGRYEQDDVPIVLPIGTDGSPHIPIIRQMRSTASAPEPTLTRLHGDAGSWLKQEIDEADKDDADAAPSLGEVTIDPKRCDMSPDRPIDVFLANVMDPSVFTSSIAVGASMEVVAYEVAALSMGKRTRTDDGAILPVITLNGRQYTHEDMANLDRRIAVAARPRDPVKRVSDFQTMMYEVCAPPKKVAIPFAAAVRRRFSVAAGAAAGVGAGVGAGSGSGSAAGAGAGVAAAAGSSAGVDASRLPGRHHVDAARGTPASTSTPSHRFPFVGPPSRSGAQPWSAAGTNPRTPSQVGPGASDRREHTSGFGTSRPSPESLDTGRLRPPVANPTPSFSQDRGHQTPGDSHRTMLGSNPLQQDTRPQFTPSPNQYRSQTGRLLGKALEQLSHAAGNPGSPTRPSHRAEAAPSQEDPSGIF